MKITKRIILIILSAFLVFSAVACGKAEEKPNENESAPKTPEEKALEIKQAYIDTHQLKSIAPKDVYLKSYGIFGDIWVVSVDYYGRSYFGVSIQEEIEGYVFEYGYESRFMVYNNKTFYNLKESFYNGILSLENIKTLYENYTNEVFTTY